MKPIWKADRLGVIIITRLSTALSIYCHFRRTFQCVCVCGGHGGTLAFLGSIMRVYRELDEGKVYIHMTCNIWFVFRAHQYDLKHRVRGTDI